MHHPGEALLGPSASARDTVATLTGATCIDPSDGEYGRLPFFGT